MKLLINKAFQVLSFSLSIFYIIFTAIGKQRIGIYEIRKGSLFNRSPDLRVFHDMESILCENKIIFRRYHSVLEHIFDFFQGNPSINASLFFPNLKFLRVIAKLSNLSVLVAIDDYRVLEQLHIISEITGKRLIGVQHAHIKEAIGPKYRKFPFSYLHSMVKLFCPKTY